MRNRDMPNVLVVGARIDPGPSAGFGSDTSALLIVPTSLQYLLNAPPDVLDAPDKLAREAEKKS